VTETVDSGVTLTVEEVVPVVVIYDTVNWVIPAGTVYEYVPGVE
jgi:hypothetical protein